MTDIVELLRVPKGCVSTGISADVLNAAADEIERLRKIEAAARDVVKYKCTSGAFVALNEVLNGHTRQTA